VEANNDRIVQYVQYMYHVTDASHQSPHTKCNMGLP